MVTMPIRLSVLGRVLPVARLAPSPLKSLTGMLALPPSSAMAAVLGRLADMTTPTLTAAVSGAILAASGVWLAADKTWREWTPVEV